MYRVLPYILAIFIVGCSSRSKLEVTDNIPDNVTSAKVIITIYSQKLALRLPLAWKPAFKDQKSESYLIEFIPKNELIESWNTLVSVQGFKNLALRTSAEKFLDVLSAQFKSTCGEHLVYEKLGASKVDGYNSYTAILGCAEVHATHPSGVKKGQSEVGYYMSIEGEKDIYLIQKSVRGNAFEAGNPPLNRQNALAFFEAFTPIELCKKGGHQAECTK